MPAGVVTVAPNDAAEVTRAEFNKLLADFTALLAKLDADAGVTDVDYNTLLTAEEVTKR